METQLSVRDLTLTFGAVRALDGISIEVRRGSIHAIIGPNGAGKTSLLNCISRVYQPSSGSISFEGRNLLRVPRHGLVRAGVARTFQQMALFKAMTVLDNVLVGHHSRTGIHPLPSLSTPVVREALDVAGTLAETFAAAVYLGPIHARERRERREAEDVLRFLELYEVHNRVVGELPYGVQKRVDLARALAARPSLLLLDEPMAGMTTYEKEVMVRFIREVNRERSITVVLIEHDMSVVMGLSEEITVLDFGRKIMSGTPAEVRVNPRVIEAYLGEDVTTVTETEAQAEEQAFRAPVPAGEET